MEYTNSGKPYQVSLVTPTGDAVPAREQNLTYTSFQRPATLSENGYSAAFTYNAAGDRVKMHLTQGSTAVLTRYYIGGQYETDTQSNTERLYLGGDVYSAPAVYVKEAGVWNYSCVSENDSISNNELVTYIESAPLFKGSLNKFIADKDASLFGKGMGKRQNSGGGTGLGKRLKYDSNK